MGIIRQSDRIATLPGHEGVGRSRVPKNLYLWFRQRIGERSSWFTCMKWTSFSVLQFQIMLSYRNYQYLCHGSYRKSACCRYIDPFTIWSPVKNKHFISPFKTARFLLSLQNWRRCTEHGGEIGISETNLLKRGASGQNGHSVFPGLFSPREIAYALARSKMTELWPGLPQRILKTTGMTLYVKYTFEE